MLLFTRTSHLSWDWNPSVGVWPVLEAGMMGQGVRFILHVKLPFILPSHPQGLFPEERNISTWINSGHFKRMEASSVGTSPTPGCVCLAHFLLPPLFSVGFVFLFSSVLSYTATVSPRGQMAFFVIFTLHPQRGVRAITQSLSPSKDS